MVEMPDPPWRTTRTKATRHPLSQDLIVDTAMKLLAAEGLDAVSMRRIAQALNTGAASLYAHVRDKEELYELIFDRVLGDVEPPEPDPKRWREQLKEMLRRQVQVMVEHPGIAKVVMETLIPIGPNALRQGEGMLAIMRAGGLSARAAAFAGDALSLYAKAYAVEVSRWRTGDFDRDKIAERGRQMGEYMSSLPPDAFPNMLEVGPLFNEETATERFEFALDAFIAGLKPDS